MQLTLILCFTIIIYNYCSVHYIYAGMSFILLFFLFSDHHGQDDMNNYISQYYSEPSSGEYQQTKTVVS